MGGLQVLPLFFLFVLLLLFQPLFTLLDAHELDPALLSTQNHWSKTTKQRKRQRIRLRRLKAATYPALFKGLKTER